MNTKEMLVKELKQMEMGLNYILDGVLNYGNEEEQIIVENVFNGGTEEGYAQNRYTLCFKQSFHEECCNFSALLEEFAETVNVEIPFVEKEEYSNLLSVFKGFDVVKEALETINDICREDSELREKLTQFESDEIDYNPFKEKGVFTFQKTFRGWSRAFQKEVRDEIGRQKSEYLLQQLK